MTKIYYKSTRGSNNEISPCEAMLNGIAIDGGLYVPNEFPNIDKSFKELMNMEYKELAYYVISKYFTDLDELELNKCIDNAYDEKFDDKKIAPLVKKNGDYFLELYHGPTLAFKDMALSILPYLLKTAADKHNLNREIVILTATSGDTGKAALEGFADVEGTRIIVFYPKRGVSQVQERQMVTQKGANTSVIGINGNFDDAQTGVKRIFCDDEFNEILEQNGYIFSSANSINIGRLIPQIVYYIFSYCELLKKNAIENGEKINICVPTGNFGNILAAFYAKKMGLPVNKLICASNENNVLTDFINTGVYDKRREFKMTISPSMDILVSSNLERLLYDISGDDSLIRNMMNRLVDEGKYEVNEEIRNGLKDFYADFATEEETYKIIGEVYNDSQYLIDTHTAVAYSVYKKYKEDTKDNTKTVIVSTASPFKFTRSVAKALEIEVRHSDDFELIKKLSNYTGCKIPNAVIDLENQKILHDSLCESVEMKEVIKKILMI